MVDLFSDPSFDLRLQRSAAVSSTADPSSGPGLYPGVAAQVSAAPAAPVGTGEASRINAVAAGSVGESTAATAAELAIPGLTALTVAARAGTSSRAKQAENIVKDRFLFALRRGAGGHAIASARGSTYPQVYTVEVQSSNPDDPSVQCTCPDFAQRGGLCKHGAALLLVLVPGSGYIAGSGWEALQSVKQEEMKVKEEDHFRATDSRLGGNGAALRVKEEEHIKVKEEERPVVPPPLPPPAEAPPHWLPNSDDFRTPAPRRPLEDSLLEPTPATSTAPSQQCSGQPLKRRKLPPSFAKALETAAAPAGAARGSAETGPGIGGACDAEATPRPQQRYRKSPKRSGADGMPGAARPPSAYQLYLRATKTFGSGEVGVKWKDLSPEERRPYEEQAHEARLKFEANPPQPSRATNSMEERTLPTRPFGLACSQPPAVPSAPAQASSSAPGQLQPSQMSASSRWPCPSCTFENSALLPACEICSAPRPADNVPPHASSSSSQQAAAIASPAMTIAAASDPGVAASSSKSAPAQALATASSSASTSEPLIRAMSASKRPWQTQEGLTAQLDLLMFPDDSPERAEVPSAAVRMSATPAKLGPPLARRKRCKYGETCYQKNPKHRNDFCHPGDQDWVAEGDGAASASSRSEVFSSQPSLSVSAALRVAAAVEARTPHVAAPRPVAAPVAGRSLEPRSEELRHIAGTAAHSADVGQPTTRDTSIMTPSLRPVSPPKVAAVAAHNVVSARFDQATASASSATTPLPRPAALPTATTAAHIPTIPTDVGQSTASAGRVMTSLPQTASLSRCPVGSAMPLHELPAQRAAQSAKTDEAPQQQAQANAQRPPVPQSTAAPTAPAESYGRPVMSFFDRLAMLDD